MMFKANAQPPQKPRNTFAPAASTFFGLSLPRAIQPAQRPPQPPAEQPDLAQRVRETGEW